MKTALALALALLLAACRAPGARAGAGPWLVHDVYFTLKDHAPAEQAALAEACHALAHLEGVAHLVVGPRVLELTRPVNDQAFDVALHVAFRDRAAHDRYQTSPEHQALLAAWTPRFESVRVFDSWGE